MRDWIVILLIGLAGVAAGWRVLMRKRKARGAAHAADADVAAARADVDERLQVLDAVSSLPGEAGYTVPNTSIAPLPENMPVAVLEFDGPPGAVPVQRGEVVIGRHSDDDVRVPDVRVSRHHARLVADAGSCEIHNLTAARAEANPMLVNGERREHARVEDGDVITLGGVSFKLRLAAG